MENVKLQLQLALVKLGLQERTVQVLHVLLKLGFENGFKIYKPRVIMARVRYTYLKIQVVHSQINTISCQLTQNMTTDCSLNYLFSTCSVRAISHQIVL